MQRCYDLHSHSYHSDGTLSPAELVQRAQEKGVNVLALTDHDVTDGLSEAEDVAQKLGLRLIPGVEISSTWEGRTLHILGLNIDATNSVLQQGLAELRAARDSRAWLIDERLQRKGIVGAHAGASALARGAILSRTHFARYLVSAGHAKDTSQAFKKFLSRGTAGAVPSPWAALVDVIGWIRAAGGQAVLAHPARYQLGSTNLRRLLTEFRSVGGTGLEVVTGSQTLQECQRSTALAQEFELLASCGSDYHGPDKPWVELGRLAPLPAACQPLWQVWE